MHKNLPKADRTAGWVQCSPFLSRDSGWERRSSRFRKERFLCKVKEGKDFRGVVLVYVAQGNPQPDAEIAEKHLFWTGTSLHFSRGSCCQFSRETSPIRERGCLVGTNCVVLLGRIEGLKRGGNRAHHDPERRSSRIREHAHCAHIC